MNNCVLVTGSTGLVGRALHAELEKRGIPAGAVSRRVCELGTRSFVVSINADADWSAALQGVKVVVHCAARVHAMEDRVADPLAAFRAVNVEGTLELARQSAAAGVQRFIFISSIKVNGERTSDRAFSADDCPKPEDAYGISKMEAENALRKLAVDTGMEVVIIRPPLVYGPGVKANFRSMMMWTRKGFPLPLGAIDNKRSLVALENLIDLVVTCIDHPCAANQIFLVSDDDDLSTTELLRRLANAMGVPSRLLPVPSKLLEVAASLMGKRAIARRVCSSLQLDIEKTKDRLNWQPPVGVDEALQRTVMSFLADQSAS